MGTDILPRISLILGNTKTTFLALQTQVVAKLGFKRFWAGTLGEDYKGMSILAEICDSQARTWVRFPSPAP